MNRHRFARNGVFYCLLASLPIFLGLGCASLKSLSSTPPAKALVLNSPANVTFSLVGSKASLPAGEYKPQYEDADAYYYAAPAKIAVRDLFSLMYDGGLVVRRGQQVPTMWYMVRSDGNINRFKLPPTVPVKVVEE